jgi:hypothetical protein
MLPTNAIITHFQHIDPELLDIMLELRNIIASVAPTATEDIQWNGLTYYDASRGGHVSAGICQINLQENHIRLAFIHGAFLQDPEGLLICEGKRIAKRYVRIDKYETAPWKSLKDLIQASSNFDPYSMTAH